MEYFSMFSGIGGFELGTQKATKGKWKCIGSSEIDKYAVEIYKKHFRHKNYGDATKIKAEDLPDFDLLCAGFPCQSFSIAGKRKGFQDTRGTLFFEIARIASVKKPKILLLENVKGILNHDRGSTFAKILETLWELGYDCEWQVLNSKHFGVPQNRERVFIIGYLRGESRGKIFPFGESNEIPYKGQGTGKVKDQLSTTITQNLKRGVHSGGETLIKVGNIDRRGHNSLWGRVYDPKGISTNLNAKGGGLGAKTGLYVTPDRKEKRQHGRRFKEDGDPSFTLTGQDIHGVMTCIDANYYKGINRNPGHQSSKRGIIDNSKIRRLTPTECERLQGFPDGWTEGISDTQRYKCLGNAVTVNVIEAIVKRIICCKN